MSGVGIVLGAAVLLLVIRVASLFKDGTLVLIRRRRREPVATSAAREAMLAEELRRLAPSDPRD